MHHLTENERFFISKRLSAGVKLTAIADELGRSRSTLSREYSRNKDKHSSFYTAIEAQNKANNRQKLASRKQRIIDSLDKKSKEELYSSLNARTSPEQISKILASEHQINVSQMSIYRHIKRDRLSGGKLYKNLRRRGRNINYGANKTKTASNKDSDKVSIELRLSRLHILMFGGVGHWEIDTIYGKNQKSFLLTLVDIASMYTIIAKMPNKEAKTVEETLDKIITTTGIPVKSITSDNGTEFANHKSMSNRYNFIWYFCHPYCSGERGLNENTNGLVRDFLPKRTDFNLYTDYDIKQIQNNLNNRPRKRLGFTRPAHAFVGMMMNSKINYNTPPPTRVCT